MPRTCQEETMRFDHLLIIQAPQAKAGCGIPQKIKFRQLPAKCILSAAKL
jgi:hypothetical protein